MTESFDAELRRALKESTARGLHGMEFTPAMRQTVLHRIAAEPHESSVPTASPSRYTPSRFMRPAAFVAVAAAAVLVFVTADLTGIGNMGRLKSAESPSAAMSKENSEQAGAASLAAVPPEEADAAAGAVPSPRSLSDGAPLVITLGDPQSAIARDQVPPADGPAIMAVGVMGPQELAVSGEHVVLLVPGEVQGISPSGETLWKKSVEDLTDRSLLAVGSDGRSAVTVGQSLQIFGPGGVQEQGLSLPDAAVSMKWSQDGRLAVAHSNGVAVYSAGRLEWANEGVGPAELAFSPDGELAVYEQEQHRLRLLDQAGATLVRVETEGGQNGVVFAAGGQAVVAGAEAYDRSGRMLWRAPVAASGVLSFSGGEEVVLWMPGTLLVVNAMNGDVAWQAQWAQEEGADLHVVVSAHGDRLAVMTRSGGQQVLWVLNAQADQLHAERLPDGPADVALSGDRLVLLHNGQIQIRELPR